MFLEWFAVWALCALMLVAWYGFEDGWLVPRLCRVFRRWKRGRVRVRVRVRG